MPLVPRPLRPALCAFVFLLPVAAPTHATRITHVFEGTIEFVDSAAGLGDFLGTRFEFRLHYDIETPGTPHPNPSLDRADYRANAVRVGDPILDLWEWTSSPNTYELIVDGRLLLSYEAPSSPFPGEERSEQLPVSVANRDAADGIGADVFAFGPVRLEDLSRTALSDSRLPTSLDLADFDIAGLGVVSVGGSGDPIPDLGGQIDTLSSSVVPEPGAATLIAAGLAFLCRRPGASPS